MLLGPDPDSAKGRKAGSGDVGASTGTLPQHLGKQGRGSHSVAVPNKERNGDPMATKIQQHKPDCKAARGRGLQPESCGCKTLFWAAITNYRCEHPHELTRAGVTCPGGERHQVKKSARTQKEARKLQTALDKRRDDDRDFPGMKPPAITPVEVGPSPINVLTVGAYAEEWVRGVGVSQAKGKRGALRQASTIRRYASLMKHVTREVGTLPLDALKEPQIEGMYARMRDQGYKEKTVLNVHRALKHALRDALRKRLISENPADLIDAPGAPQYEAHPPTAEETRRIIEAAKGTQIAELVAVAAWTGARQGELLALQWPDVDFDAASMIIRKSKTQSGHRKIPLTPGTVAMLRAYRAWQDEQRDNLTTAWADTGYVFVTRIGKPIDDSTLRREWDRVRTGAGVKCRFHDLRHGFATFLLGQGVPAKVASSLLGHSRISITLDTYSHLIPSLGLEEQAIAALDQNLGGTA